jgi:phosphatidylserine/phosphatidylglycerophosphate/cardiolipin synthase-like enzyme
MTRPAIKPRGKARPSTDRFVFAAEDRLPTVLAVIGSARKRLLLSLFRCDDFDILDALAAALQRGVEVQVLVTPRAKGWTKRLRELWDVLEGMGAKLHRAADPVVKYHAKYIVADDGPALVASLNFTRKCFTSTVDFVLTTSDPAVVSGLRRLFIADSRRPEPARVASFGRRLVVGPEYARREFTRLLGRARRSIAIVDPKLTDPAILDLLKVKRREGVAVTVLGREHAGGLTPHGKMLIVDGSVAVIGSMSLSALSLDFRREVALIVRDRAQVGEMRRVFERLAARPPAAPGKPVR